MAGADGSGTGISTGRATKGRLTGRLRKSGGISQGLMLASMLDILMVILFFLLKNFSSSVSDFSVGKDIQLPPSSAISPPQPALQLVVTKNSITLDNLEIASIINGDVNPKALFRDGITIIPLKQALDKHKEGSLYVQKTSDKNSFTGTIIMQADKSLLFSLLKKVIYTAGISDFVMLKLAVLKKEEGGY